MRFLTLLVLLFLSAIPAFAKDTKENVCRPISQQVIVTFGDTLNLREEPSVAGEYLGNVVTEGNQGVLLPIGYVTDADGSLWLFVATSRHFGWILGASTIPYFEGGEDSSFEERLALDDQYNPPDGSTNVALALCLPELPSFSTHGYLDSVLATSEGFGIESNPTGWMITVQPNWSVRSGAGQGNSVARTTEGVETHLSFVRIRTIMVGTLDLEWYLILDEGEVRFVGQYVATSQDR